MAGPGPPYNHYVGAGFETRLKGSEMASIGVIVRSNRPLAELEEDWIPQPLGTRSHVIEVLENSLRNLPAGIDIRFEVEDESENESPRSISVSGIFGPAEMEVIQLICKALEAKFFDAETSDFIEL